MNLRLPQSPADTSSPTAPINSGTSPADVRPVRREARRYSVARVLSLAATVACGSGALIAIGTSTAPASAIAAPAYTATANIHDSMSRTVAVGLGKANLGGAWAASPARMFSVSGGSAHIKAIPRDQHVRASLPMAHSDERLRVAFVLPKVPSTGSFSAALDFRRQRTGAVYQVRLQVAAGGKLTLGFLRTRLNRCVAIGAPVTLSQRASSGKTIMLDGQVTGSLSVQLRARAWIAGTAAPGWQAAYTDTSASRFSLAGSVGVYLSSHTSSTASRATIDSFDGWWLHVVDPAATPSPGQPGPNNTGVPAGTKLTRHDGDMTITKAGATYDALDIHGFVTIKAANVTIKRSIIRGGVAKAGSSVGVVTDTSAAGTNFLLQDSEIVPAHPSVAIDGIKGWNYTLNRVDIHGTVDNAKIYGNNTTIENSWLHDTVYYLHDPYQNNGPTHNDGVQVLSGSNIHIVHNTITGSHNSGMQVTQGHGVVKGLSFTSNWADGGGCTVNLTNLPMTSVMANVTVASNRFGHATRIANCPIIATRAVQLKTSANVYDDSGAPAPVRNGG